VPHSAESKTFFLHSAESKHKRFYISVKATVLQKQVILLPHSSKIKFKVIDKITEKSTPGYVA
jgi:hypothetical protein